MPLPLSISFEGAARTVTGSRHRIRFGERSWLFDCGLFQGHRDEAERVNRTFRFDPAKLDAVVLSHAHLDHSGNLPTLVSQGFRGPIHATAATTDLCRAMLADSASMMERDAEHASRQGSGRGHASRRPARRPLYTPADVEETMGRFQSHGYHEPWPLFEGVRACYYDAGHILGSALTTFEFESEGRRFRLCMSGDLGRPARPILRDPELPPGGEALVMESTYGDRLHSDSLETERIGVKAIDVVSRTDRKSTRLNSSHGYISYAVFCLKKKK